MNNNNFTQCTDVVVIGNGPSAINMSYLLSGYRPYYNGNLHTNNYLTEKLQSIGHDQSILTQDLEYLCEGLEGRSSNPVALLFDALMHPDADMGAENPPLVDWKREINHSVRHMVLGKGKPGGAWQNMDGNMHTLSLGNWMELPSVSLKSWYNEKYSDDDIEPYNNRATIADVRNYYSDFVKNMNMENNFYDYHTVTSVQKVYQTKNGADSESGEVEPCCKHAARNHPFLWEVRGYKVVRSDINENEDEEDCEREEFCILAPNVVIATGTFDIPNRLKIVGETFPHVKHELQELEKDLEVLTQTADPNPVLIVGAGLSAADAILMTLSVNIPVIHVFRRGANDQNLIFKKLPAVLYPEYHEIHSLMRGKSSNPLYRPYAKHKLTEVREDLSVIIENIAGDEVIPESVSSVVVLIGARPDLSFLSNGGKDLGIVPRYAVDSKHNPVDIDPYSYQCMNQRGLFSLGPLVGDNFVRFGIGGALGIMNYITKMNEKGAEL